jgi:hypothetical protein
VRDCSRTPRGAFAREIVLPSAILRALPAGIDLRVAALTVPAAVA